MKSRGIIFLLTIFLFFPSCSLIYRTEIEEDEASEITLFDLVQTKVHDGKIEHIVKAKQLEQYRKNAHAFAREVSFTLFDKDGTIETEGKTGNLKSEKEEVLYFSDGVEITSYKDDTHVSAESLRVNTQLEQLTSAKNDSIEIQYGIGEKKNSKLYIYANTIAASGLSNTIQISGRVHGFISIDDAADNDDAEYTSDSQDENIVTGDFN